MKLNKKFLSCFMAATMMVNSATVFAADEKVGEGTVNGIGNVHYVNTEVYNIILPTNEALDFDIDPYDLLSLTGSNSYDVETAEASAAAAETNITSKATAVINKSSYPVNVKVEAKIHNVDMNQTDAVDSSNPSGAAVALTDNAANVKDASTVSYAGMYLAITPVSGATISSVVTGGSDKVTDLTLDSINVANKTVTGAIYSLSDASINLANAVSDSVRVQPITANGTGVQSEFDFRLEGIPQAYKITSAGGVAVLDEADVPAILANADSINKMAYVFYISGKVDYSSPVWKEFSSDQNSGVQQKIGLQMKFIISKAEKENIQTFDDGDTITVSSGSDFTFKSTFPNVTEVFLQNNGTNFNVTTGVAISGNTMTLSTNSSNSDLTAFMNAPGTYTMYIFNGTDYHTLTFKVE